MANQECEIKIELLAEYKCKVAEREHQEILAAGTGEGVGERSAKRIDAIKTLLHDRQVELYRPSQSAGVKRQSETPSHTQTCNSDRYSPGCRQQTLAPLRGSSPER